MERPFKAPFRSLLILSVLTTAYNAIAFVPNDRPMSRTSIFALIVLILIVNAVIMGEASFYWLNRHRINKKSWAMIHVSLLYLVLIIMPLANTFLFWYARQHSQIEYFQLVIKFTVIRTYIVWVALAIAHLFFIATIVRTLRTKKPQHPDANSASNILDDFSN